MGYWEYDTGYYEPSEFDEKCEELKGYLRDSVTKELKEKLETLQKENERMKDIVDNYDAKVRELDAAKEKFKFDERNLRDKIRSEVRRERLSKLLEDFQTMLYQVLNIPVEQPKCDKCNANRMIEFFSPSGQRYTEKCQCAKRLPHFEVIQANCVEFKLMGDKICGWYSRCDLSNTEEYYHISGEYVADKMYDGRDFASIDNYYNVYFRDKATAQKYADWLNDNECKKQ